MEPTIRLSKEGKLLVHLPSLVREDAKGHTIIVPATSDGVRFLVETLRARAAQPGPIATAASPTQEMVREWLKHNKPQRLGQKQLADGGKNVRFKIDLDELGL